MGNDVVLKPHMSGVNPLHIRRRRRRGTLGSAPIRGRAKVHDAFDKGGAHLLPPGIEPCLKVLSPHACLRRRWEGVHTPRSEDGCLAGYIGERKVGERADGTSEGDGHGAAVHSKLEQTRIHTGIRRRRAVGWLLHGVSATLDLERRPQHLGVLCEGVAAPQPTSHRAVKHLEPVFDLGYIETCPNAIGRAPLRTLKRGTLRRGARSRDARCLDGQVRLVNLHAARRRFCESAAPRLVACRQDALRLGARFVIAVQRALVVLPRLSSRPGTSDAKVVVVLDRLAANETAHLPARRADHLVAAVLFDVGFEAVRTLAHEGFRHGLLDRVPAVQLCVRFGFLAALWNVVLKVSCEARGVT